MKQVLGLAALTAAATLAVPAAAAAHPSVYTSDSYGIAPNTTDQLALQTRYVVTNHGYTMVLRETNDPTAANADLQKQGVVGYNLAPGGWRSGKSFAAVMTQAATAAQAHATCLTPALQSEQAIKAWQDADAFYNYVPFQATSAGLEDDPARWLPVLTSQNFNVANLGTPAAAEAECEKVPGATYVPADTVQTTADALASGTVALKTTPLSTEINSLKAAKAAVDAQLAAALAPKPVTPRPLTLKLSAKKFQQAVAMVTGDPNTAVTVRALLSSADAKKLKISRTISSKKATIDGQGAALVDLGLTAKAAKAVDKHLPALKVTVEATAGAAKQTATGSLTR
ncbi:hypothetical protein DVA67_011020 [Solirubrobacter sp. CPCC 204708]|uniref:SCP domain-containing protein n=1 Tax=Solirubrobacter deserti TaxID=2282478 RepID=A0ABT4RHU5_9ACTN|nr:hypothetical protein [Solirubrobacter deserti]MBE2316510.1 hypothetical protein [Solirubrobacter deserti]MDA0138043.1 hypothetical protein [Solirubrobacter deserti]